jgi:lipocalin-like protein
MKSMLSRGIGVLAILMTLLSSAALLGKGTRPLNESIQAQLVGAWRLAWIETEGTDGQLHRLDRTGILVYTNDGHMSVQIMAREAGAPAPSGPVQYEQGGYEAYYGRYDVDPSAHSVTHHVEGALVRSLIGHDLTRMCQFSGKQLVLKSSRADEHWTIAWEHY